MSTRNVFPPLVREGETWMTEKGKIVRLASNKNDLEADVFGLEEIEFRGHRLVGIWNSNGNIWADNPETLCHYGKLTHRVEDPVRVESAEDWYANL